MIHPVTIYEYTNHDDVEHNLSGDDKSCASYDMCYQRSYKCDGNATMATVKMDGNATTIHVQNKYLQKSPVIDLATPLLVYVIL